MIILCKATFFAIASIGQATNEVDHDLSVSQQRIAPVKVDGRVLFYASGISSFTPQ